MAAFTEILEESGGVSASPETRNLSELQQAELDAAMAYHALCNPGAQITYLVHVGGVSQLPILTDERCIDGIEHAGEPEFTFRTHSTAVGSAQRGPRDAELVRHLRLAHADATPATAQPRSESLPRRIYREAERRRVPMLDTVREGVTRRRERAISVPLARYPEAPGSNEISDAYADQLPASAPPTDAPPAILFGLHWLQAGGAERWAVETIQIAKAQGFVPVVITDRQSVHPWLTRAELEDCVSIVLTSESGAAPLDPILARAVLENFDLRGVVIHHCSWLYRSLPWVKQQRPEIPVVDSLHVVEYLGGGFAGAAVSFDEFIDRHHTISPELDRWLVEVQDIDSQKVDMAPLTALTVEGDHAFVPRDTKQPFTIAFIARLARQKRPDVFITLVRHLQRRGIPVRAIMQGDGEMRDIVDELIERHHLQDLIERRGEDTPVSQTLAESDLMILTSMIEGLSLTTFEAVAAGVPVLSADVGSQRTIVQDDMLLPRPARDFIRAAEIQISALLVSERAREQIWQAQRERVDAFGSYPDASDYMKQLFSQWQAEPGAA